MSRADPSVFPELGVMKSEISEERPLALPPTAAEQLVHHHPAILTYPADNSCI